MVSVKITCSYFFMLKNCNKHVRNTQISCFLHFFWLIFFKIRNLVKHFYSIFKELLYAVF